MEELKQKYNFKVLVLAALVLGFLVVFFIFSLLIKTDSKKVAKEATISQAPQEISRQPFPSRSEKNPTPSISQAPAPTIILPAIETWKSYTGSKFNFRYPSDWFTTTEYVDDGEFVSIQPNRSKSAFLIRAVVRVQKEHIPQNPALRENPAFGLQALGYSVTSETINNLIFTKLTRIAGADSINGIQIQGPIFETYYNLSKDGYVYSMGYLYNSESKDVFYENVFRSILSTVKFQ